MKKQKTYQSIESQANGLETNFFKQELLDVELEPRYFEDENTFTKLPVRNGSKWTVSQEKEAASDKSTKPESLLNYKRQDEDKDPSGIQNSMNKKYSATSLLSGNLKSRTLILGYMCGKVTEDPERSTSHIKTLVSCFEIISKWDLSSVSEEDLQFSLLLCKCISQMFADIIPDYSVREYSATELSAKVTAEVRRQRDLEGRLVKNYENLLGILKSFSHRQEPIYAILSAKFTSKLVTSCCNFNFSEELLAMAVDGATGKCKSAVKSVCDALEEMFMNDQLGMNSAYATERILIACKKKKFSVNPLLIRTLLSLRLRSEFSSIKEQKEKVSFKGRARLVKKFTPHQSKREKSEAKKMKKNQRELAESDAVFSAEEKKKWQTRTLTFVFRILFNILKDKHVSLYPEALEALCMYAHLIDVHFFSGILMTLRDLIEGGLNLSPRFRSLSAVMIISKRQKDLSLDLRFFFGILFNALYELLNVQLTEELIQSVDDAVRNMFREGGQLPANRVAAFVHRMSHVAVELGTRETKQGDESIPLNFLLSRILLRNVNSLTIRYSNVVSAMLSDEPVGSGIFRIDARDPDSGNAFARNLCSVSLSRGHPDEECQALIKKILRLKK